ncbi:MAG: O-antigen ligase family protein [Anaerolineae bacterium]
MSELLFLDTLYEQHSEEWFDIVSAQPYGFEDPVNAPPDWDRLNWQRISLLREVMEVHGDAETAVWAVSSGLTGAAAESLESALEQARLQWPWLGPVLWAAWNSGDRQGQYALVGSDGRPGETYERLRRSAVAPARAWPGVYPANHPSGHYEGDWRVTPSGADIGGSGDRLTIPFRGTRLDLTVRRGDYRAFLFVTVDGKPANGLPRDAKGRTYIVLYDPLQQVATVTLARDLADGPHLVELVAERGWGQWAIVGWSVLQESSRGVPWWPIGLSLGTIVVIAATVYRSWPHREPVLQSVSTIVDRYRFLDDRFVLILTAGAAALLHVVVGSVPTLVTLVILAVLLVLRPEMGLVVIAFALPFYQLGRPILGKVFSMVEILTLLTAGGWLVNAVLVERWSLLDISRLRQRLASFAPIDWGVWRVRGFYGSPNNLALYLGKLFPVAVALVAWGRHGQRRLFYGVATVLIALAIFLTYSRGAWIVGVPASLLFLAALRGRRTLVLATGILVLVGAIVLLLAGVGRLTSLLDTAGGTTFFRLQLWQSSWAMIRDHPLLGVGLDNFLYHYRTYYVLPTAWEEFNLSHPHNLVFDFWLRLGVPGLAAFLWVMVSFFQKGFITYRLLPQGNERLLTLGMMAGMVNLVAHGLVDNAFFLVDLAFALVLMLAVVQAVADELQLVRHEQQAIGSV